MNQNTAKQEAERIKFIGKYLDKHMKDHGLPYGIAYFNLVSDTEEKAEKAWKRKLKTINMEQKEKFTWADLKKFVNELPEQELSKEVIWWGEERGGNINFAECLAEDYVITDYGSEPLSVQEEPEDGEEWEIAYKKGTPILHTD